MKRFGWMLRRALQGVALIVAGIGAAILVGWYADQADNPLVPSGRWLGWAGQTAILFYLLLSDWRHSGRRTAVWLVCVALFVCHTVACAVVFEHVREWRPAWFPLLLLIEYPMFAWVLLRIDPRIDDGGNSSRHVE